MTRRTAYALIALAGALVLLGMSLWPPPADALPLFAHTPHARATATCPDGAFWHATPVVSVDNPGGTWTVDYSVPLKADGTWHVAKTTQTLSVTATFHYTDGHADDVRYILIDRPVGCDAPPDAPTTTPTSIVWTPPMTPPTTTVDGTVPMTPIGPPTTLPAVASSVVRSPDTTVDASPPSSGTPASEVLPAPRGPATTAHLTLPVTGGTVDTLGWIVAVLLIVGIVAGVVARAKREHEGEG